MTEPFQNREDKMKLAKLGFMVVAKQLPNVVELVDSIERAARDPNNPVPGSVALHGKAVMLNIMALKLVILSTQLVIDAGQDNPDGVTVSGQ